eukprot:TRINITY_DN27732_c0_g1_i1.p1 TRINITY_DN27732_c0_g1~~TRINITY_DN27732_c0_g1_i1.p1  ORF type:complete len:494 (-),score=44.74 TRINITY_DN27732_c0_g1_i1:6-1487(-)
MLLERENQVYPPVSTERKGGRKRICGRPDSLKIVGGDYPSFAQTADEQRAKFAPDWEEKYPVGRAHTRGPLPRNSQGHKPCTPESGPRNVTEVRQPGAEPINALSYSGPILVALAAQPPPVVAEWLAHNAMCLPTIPAVFPQGFDKVSLAQPQAVPQQTQPPETQFSAETMPHRPQEEYKAVLHVAPLPNPPKPVAFEIGSVKKEVTVVPSYGRQRNVLQDPHLPPASEQNPVAASVLQRFLQRKENLRQQQAVINSKATECSHTEGHHIPAPEGHQLHHSVPATSRRPFYQNSCTSDTESEPPQRFPFKEISISPELSHDGTASCSSPFGHQTPLDTLYFDNTEPETSTVDEESSERGMTSVHNRTPSPSFVEVPDVEFCSSQLSDDSSRNSRFQHKWAMRTALKMGASFPTASSLITVSSLTDSELGSPPAPATAPMRVQQDTFAQNLTDLTSETLRADRSLVLAVRRSTFQRMEQDLQQTEELLAQLGGL